MRSPYLNDASFFKGIPECYSSSGIGLSQKANILSRDNASFHAQQYTPVVSEMIDHDIPYTVQRFWCDGLALRGYMLAAAALAGDTETVRNFLEILHTHSSMTGTLGRWCRDIIPIDSPQGQWAIAQIDNPTCEDAYYFQECTDYPYVMWTDISRDQLYGLLYGLTLAKLYINDITVQNLIIELSYVTLQRIICDDYQLVNPSGSSPRFGNVSPSSGSPESTMPCIILALLSNQQYRYADWNTWIRRNVIRYMPYDFTWFNNANCSNQNMYNIGNFCLAVLTGDVFWCENLQRQHRFTYKYCNPMWIYNAYMVNNYEGWTDTDSLSNAKKMLQLFPVTKRLVSTTVECAIPSEFFRNRYGQITAATAVHPGFNNDFFNWTVDTRSISDTTWDGILRFAPSDYLIAYHMGKRLGLIMEDE